MEEDPFAILVADSSDQISFTIQLSEASKPSNPGDPTQLVAIPFTMSGGRSLAEFCSVVRSHPLCPASLFPALDAAIVEQKVDADTKVGSASVWIWMLHRDNVCCLTAPSATSGTVTASPSPLTRSLKHAGLVSGCIVAIETAPKAILSAQAPTSDATSATASVSSELSLEDMQQQSTVYPRLLTLANEIVLLVQICPGPGSHGVERRTVIPSGSDGGSAAIVADVQLSASASAEAGSGSASTNAVPPAYRLAAPSALRALRVITTKTATVAQLKQQVLAQLAQSDGAAQFRDVTPRSCRLRR